jgi:hypothetical protein
MLLVTSAAAALLVRPCRVVRVMMDGRQVGAGAVGDGFGLLGELPLVPAADHP